MKKSIIAILLAAGFAGFATPSADAATIVIHTGRHYSHRGHRVWVSGHHVRRHGHRYWVPGHYVWL